MVTATEHNVVVRLLEIQSEKFLDFLQHELDKVDADLREVTENESKEDCFRGGLYVAFRLYQRSVREAAEAVTEEYLA